MRVRRRPLVTVGFMSGIPAVVTPFWWSSLRLVQYNAEALDFEVAYDQAGISEHSEARNLLARRMAGDWLLMLDMDHEPEPDTLARLLNAAQSVDALVMSGLYRYKTPPYHPCAFLWGEKPGQTAPVAVWDRPLFTVDSVGGGCLLIHRSVFDRIRAELNEEPFDKVPFVCDGRKGLWGEDHSFCQRCETLGIPVWLHTGVECYHLRYGRVTQEDFDQHAPACVLNPEQISRAA